MPSTRWFLLAVGVLTCALLMGTAPSAQRSGTTARQKPKLVMSQEETPGSLAIMDSKGNSRGNCPLKHTDVRIGVSGYVSRVNVTQEFQNPLNEPIEAVYTFPLPNDAAVDDMTMIIGKRVIKGMILKREEAREVYESAKAAGKTSALLDQQRSNIFTQSVANIPPGESIKITIQYVNLLKYQDGWYELVFPMVVGPRFVGNAVQPTPTQTPANRKDTTPVVSDAAKITPPMMPKGIRAGHSISLSVQLDSGIPLTDIRSTLHPIEVQKVDNSRAVVRLANQREIPNKDFVLRYTSAGKDIETGTLANATKYGGKTHGYFTLIVQPPKAAPREKITPKEMVFVIDQTGSQAGEPIAKAKETMRHCIQNLNPGDTFQLIGFNTQIFPCFDKPVHATPETIAQALKFLEPLEGRGGTDILKSVDYALKIPDDPDRLRIICYMTDGYVGNDMQIIDYIQKNRGRTRMFPFGVGNSVNRLLIDKMATEGRGTAEYITMYDKGLDAAKRFYHRVADPLLLDVKVDWNNLPVEDVYPKHIPDLFSNQPIVIKGRYTAAAEGVITISGLLRGKPWTQNIRLRLPEIKNAGEEIRTIWAREHIEDLQSRIWLGTQRGDADPSVQKQIVDTALEYRLMSQYTSFVAVEQRIVNVGGKQRRIEVPVEMPEGVSMNATSDKRLYFMRGATSLSSNGTNLGGSNFGVVKKDASNSLLVRPAKPGSPALEQRKLSESLADDNGLLDGKESEYKELSKLDAESRKTLLANLKLATNLKGLAKTVAKEGKNGNLKKSGLPEVVKGRVEVQIRLNALPKEGLAKLKALGFEVLATLEPNRLLLGTVDVKQLEALTELAFVRRIEVPRFR